MTDDIAERVSALEAQVIALTAAQESTGGKVDKMCNEWSRYRGFVGGVMFVITMGSAFLGSLFRGWVTGHWK